MTRGRCCFTWPNEKGAHYVLLLDMLFIFNIPRWIFAIWTKFDQDRWPIYARMRLCSFYMFWLLIFGVYMGDVIKQVYETEAEPDHSVYINTMAFVGGMSIAIISDFHFQRVVIYHAKTHAKRIDSENKAKLKR